MGRMQTVYVLIPDVTNYYKLSDLKQNNFFPLQLWVSETLLSRCGVHSCLAVTEAANGIAAKTRYHQDQHRRAGLRTDNR